MMSVPMQQSKKIMKKLELNELNEKSKTDMQNVATHFVSIQTFLQHFQNPSLFSKHDC
jgi:hypothetical protein